MASRDWTPEEAALKEKVEIDSAEELRASSEQE